MITTDIEHGNRGGGPLHTNATRDVDGFMSAEDKATVERASTAPATKTADYTVLATDGWLIFNGAGTIVVTLPDPASSSGRVLECKTIAAQLVNSASANVVPAAGGAATTSILPATAGAWATLMSDGTNWQIMRRG